MFLGLTLLSLAIPALLGALLGPVLTAAGIVSESPAARIISALVTFLLVVIFMLLFQGAITYAVFQIFMGGRASFGESLGRSFSRVLDLFFVAFWGILIMALPFLALGVLGALFGRNFWTILLLIAALVGIVVPSVLFCRWYVSAPVCVVEKTGALRSLKRSGQLTKGRRWKIYSLFALVMIIVSIISGVVEFIVKRTIDIEFIGILILIAVKVVPLAFANITPTVVYYSLRVEKENLTAASLADIFD
jgi:hypothetical protein